MSRKYLTYIKGFSRITVLYNVLALFIISCSKMTSKYGMDGQQDVKAGISSASSGPRNRKILDLNYQLIQELGYKNIPNIAQVTSLLQQGADVNQIAKDGCTPLRFAASKGHVEIVDLLLHKGADVNQITSNGRTPLHWAASGGHIKIVDLLLEKRANVNRKNKNGSTPLHCAAQGGHLETVKLLLNKGADVNIKNEQGDTPLDLAVDRDHQQIVELF